MVSENAVDGACHYLPYRPVVKEHSTTKIRPVFDASAFQEGYPSLDHSLEKGPNLIEQVPSILNRFREREIGVVADIKKAFLQIEIDEKDRDFLRFFWIINGLVVILRHCRVVFGLACSPFLLSAIIELHLSKALKKARLKVKLKWSQKTVQKLKISFYVDNCVTSVDTEIELQTFIHEANNVMLAGFELRGWESSRDNADSSTTMVLGVLWGKQRDEIRINPSFLEFETPKLITKRSILSCTQRVFDPIGVTCPITLQPKLILQELWTEKLDWDSEVRGKPLQDFCQWLKNLPLIKEISIPRKIGNGQITLHAFGDASGTAYAAAIFVRVERENKVCVSLLQARSRVAPKKATIPRLELMAASIAAKLLTATAASLSREVMRTYCWTDSTTVLAWINRDTEWGTFVYNRVKEIRT